jgi:hypothetical protein
MRRDLYMALASSCAPRQSPEKPPERQPPSVHRQREQLIEHLLMPKPPPRKFLRYIYDFEVELPKEVEVSPVGSEAGGVEWLAEDGLSVADINRVRDALNSALLTVTGIRFTGNFQLSGPRLFDDNGDVAQTILDSTPYGWV